MINITKKFTSHNNEEIKRKGVYSITCSKNKKWIYIGSTFCKEGFYKRWYCHINKLKRNLHFNPILQNIINKYGLDSISFNIIEVINTKELTYEREVFWINYFDNLKDIKITNISKEVFASKDRIISQYTKDKISKSLKGRKNHGKTNPLYQYDYKGNFIKKWECSTRISEELGGCRNKYYFKSNIKGYKDFILSKNKCSDLEIKEIKNGKYDYMKSSKKPILQFSENNEFIKEWDSAKSAAIYYNVNRSTITQALIGLTKKSCGYIWKYKN